MSAPAVGPTFTSAATVTARGSTQALSPQATEAVLQRQDRALEKAETHFEKHRDQWVSKRYHQLLKADAPVPSLKPVSAVEDRAAHLMRAATRLVERKQASRLQTIRAAAQTLAYGRQTEGLGRS